MANDASKPWLPNPLRGIDVLFIKKMTKHTMCGEEGTQAARRDWQYLFILRVFTEVFPMRAVPLLAPGSGPSVPEVSRDRALLAAAY